MSSSELTQTTSSLISQINLPSLEELKAQGPATPGRELTQEEQAQAKIDKAAKPTPFKTKKKSEALCKRHFEKFAGVTLKKVRDDLITRENGESYRVSEDVDFAGTIQLIINKRVRSCPLRVEAKGVTLQKRGPKHVGAFSLSSLSKVQRQYLEANRQKGGLSVIHLSWWYKGECLMAHLIPWKRWVPLQEELLYHATGNYKGKSLRYHEDIGIIYDCKIYKVSGQWEMVSTHWLRPYLPSEETLQPKLLPI